MAHATYPADLDEAGLAAALGVLSEWLARVELGALPEGRLDPSLESGIYFIVAALTRPGGDGAVADVNVKRERDRQIVDIRSARRGT